MIYAFLHYFSHVLTGFFLVQPPMSLCPQPAAWWAKSMNCTCLFPARSVWTQKADPSWERWSKIQRLIFLSSMYIMKTYASRHFHHDARLDIIFYLLKASNHLIHRLADSFSTQCLRKNGLDYVRWYVSTVYKPWDLTGWWCWIECMFATFPKLDRIGIEPIPACSQQIGTGEFFQMKGHLFTPETFCNKQFFWTTKA